MKIEYLNKDAPPCPLIRIFGGTEEEYKRLHEAVGKLASEAPATVRLHEIPGFEPLNHCNVAMISGTEDIGIRKTSRNGNFDWTLTPYQWETVQLLMEPFLTNNSTGGYQWLTNGFRTQSDEIAVLLSKTKNGSW